MSRDGLARVAAAEKQREVAEIARSDPHAPRYHLVSPERDNICFDPNGALFWRGRYHLFYVCQDPALKTGTEFRQAGHCWGHASSADLVHWTYHPTALAPAAGDPDTAIFSGCALLDRQGVPTLVYHGVGAGTCIATPEDDGLIRWRKSPHNPVIREPRAGEPGWGVYNVFDPHVWLDGETYYAILGGFVKPKDRRDTAYLFRSCDLLRWEYLHPFYAPNPDWTGEGDDCACPDFFALGGKHVLLCISHATGARAYTGALRGETFVPDRHWPMNGPGGARFAPETLLDDRGRRIFWAWALDQRPGWWERGVPGVMTLPRVLSLGPDGAPAVEPPVELQSLRRNGRSRHEVLVSAGRDVHLDEMAGDCLELVMHAEPREPARFGLKLLAAPDGAEQTSIVCDTAAGELAIDVSRSSLDGAGWRPWPLDFWREGVTSTNTTRQAMPFRLQAGEPLKLRVFLDRSMLEVFANGRLCLTQRVYPSRRESRRCMLFAERGSVRVRRIDAWDMDPVNEVVGRTD